MKSFLLRLKRFCGFLAGFVFFIAGVFKLLDPVGSGLVMKEYMNFLHLGFMEGIARPSAALLAFAETVMGTALVTGVWRRLTAVVALAFQGVFTLLTLALLIANPEMDCGCFGEVVHLTHLQTFLKNVVLLLMLVAFAFPFRCLGGPKKHKYVSFAIVVVSTFVFGLYSWIYIPLVDYTAFKPAAPLQASSAFGIQDEDRYEAVFVYEKDGKQEEFSLGDLPDSTWTFISTRTILNDDYADAGVSLSFYDERGDYQDTLAVNGKVMVVSVYDVEVRPAVWERISHFKTLAEVAGFHTLVLVSELPPDVEMNDMYLCDYKTLISMNRSNGGVTYFSDGYLVRKWSARSRPDMEQLREIYAGDDTEVIIDADSKGRLAFQGFLLYVFAVMLLL